MELTSRDIDDDSRRGAEEPGSPEPFYEDQPPHQGTRFIRTRRDLAQPCKLALGCPPQHGESGKTSSVASASRGRDPCCPPGDRRRWRRDVPRHCGRAEQHVQLLCIRFIRFMELIPPMGPCRRQDERWPDDQRLSSALRGPSALALQRSNTAQTSRTEMSRCAAMSTSVKPITCQR